MKKEVFEQLIPYYRHYRGLTSNPPPSVRLADEEFKENYWGVVLIDSKEDDNGNNVKIFMGLLSVLLGKYVADSDLKIDLQNFNKEDQFLKEKLIHFLREYPFEEALEKKIGCNYKQLAFMCLDFLEYLIEEDVFFKKGLSSISFDEMLQYTPPGLMVDTIQIIIDPNDIKENYSSFKEKLNTFLESQSDNKEVIEYIEVDLASYERMSSDIDAELVGFDPDFAHGGKHHYKTALSDE